MDGVLFAFLVVLVLLVLYLYYRHHARPDSLYTRLGGIYAIAAVVDYFSDELIKDPVVGKDSANPYLREWNRTKLDRLPGLKFMRTLWLAALAGGPFRFHPSSKAAAGRCPFSLEQAHGAFQIAPSEFDAVAAVLSRSLDQFKVGAQEKAEVLAAFTAHRPEVLAGYDVAHGVPPTLPSCPFSLLGCR